MFALYKQETITKLKIKLIPEGVNEPICPLLRVSEKWTVVQTRKSYFFFSDPRPDYNRYSGKTDGLTLTAFTYKTEQLGIHWRSRITGIIFSQ